MKLRKTLEDIVKTDYMPLQRDQEGLLRGGFGSIITDWSSATPTFNFCFNFRDCRGVNNSCQPSPSPSPSPLPTLAPLPQDSLPHRDSVPGDSMIELFWRL